MPLVVSFFVILFDLGKGHREGQGQSAICEVLGPPTIVYDLTHGALRQKS